MIDIHCHILPGLDDGPATMEESVAMCRMAARDGITRIVATPHFRPGMWEPAADEVFEKIRQLQQDIDDAGIKVTLLPGAEVTLSPEVSGYLTSLDYLTINRTGQYFLAEFPCDSVPARWDDFLLSLARTGMKPILSHPERHSWFLNHPEALFRYVFAGGIIQMTAMSLTGELGNDVARFSLQLLRRNLVHVIASDGHSPKLRSPVLSQAFARVREAKGEAHARLLLHDNPEAIISGREVGRLEPVLDVPKRSWLNRLAGSWIR